MPGISFRFTWIDIISFWRTVWSGFLTFLTCLTFLPLREAFCDPNWLCLCQHGWNFIKCETFQGFFFFHGIIWNLRATDSYNAYALPEFIDLCRVHAKIKMSFPSESFNQWHIQRVTFSLPRIMEESLGRSTRSLCCQYNMNGRKRECPEYVYWNDCFFWLSFTVRSYRVKHKNLGYHLYERRQTVSWLCSIYR